jgi:hypothetical protein
MPCYVLVRTKYDPKGAVVGAQVISVHQSLRAAATSLLDNWRVEVIDGALIGVVDNPSDGRLEARIETRVIS